MKRLCFIGLTLILSFFLVQPSTAFAQGNQVRPSLKASVMQVLGADTAITITYSRPGVKGRKIWGELVPYSMASGDQPSIWRAGANENTTIEFNKDILVEGNKLPAGKYGIHMIPSEKDWIVIFSKNNSSWGSMAYKQEEDALRVTVTPVKVPHREWMSFGFGKLAGTSATVYLHWEELAVPFKIELPKEE